MYLKVPCFTAVLKDSSGFIRKVILHFSWILNLNINLIRKDPIRTNQRRAKDRETIGQKIYLKLYNNDSF